MKSCFQIIYLVFFVGNFIPFHDIISSVFSKLEVTTLAPTTPAPATPAPATPAPSTSCEYKCFGNLTFSSGSQYHIGFSPPTNGAYEDGIIKGCLSVQADVVCNTTFYNLNAIVCSENEVWVRNPDSAAFEDVKFCGEPCLANSCSLQLASNSIALPKQVQFEPFYKGLYFNDGLMLGCIGALANLQCDVNLMYFMSTNSSDVTLSCLEDQKWVLESDNTIVEYLPGCTSEPPCIVTDGKNDYNLTLVSKDAGVVYSSDDSRLIFDLMGPDQGKITFKCPESSERVFDFDTYRELYTMTCVDGLFNRWNLPPCYAVNTDTVEDPNEKCSGSPSCMHFMKGLDSNTTFASEKGILDLKADPISLKACIGNALTIECLNPMGSLLVQKSGDTEWIFLDKKKIMAKCNEVPNLKDVFLMKTNLKNYYYLSNTSDTYATYQCFEPKPSTTSTTTTDITTSTTTTTPTSTTETSTSTTTEPTTSDTTPTPTSSTTTTTTTTTTQTTETTPTLTTKSSTINSTTDDSTTTQTTTGSTAAGDSTSTGKSVPPTETPTKVTTSAPDSPFTPVIVLDKNEMPYKDTADYQCSEIDSCFTGTEGEGTYQVVKGPPGFGVASGFSGTCRVKEGGFDSETEKCLLNPKDCGETGLSFCTWEKHFNYQNVLNDPGKPNNSSYWYIVSTGGDMNGHPGFALYHEQHYIVAVVSTGEKYWTVDAVAQSEAGCWVNIGVTWDLTNGIKLYFNATKFGESSYARSVTAKSSLNPPQIMMGCHKTVDDTKYSGFNPNSSLDEFSLWNHCLKDEKNNKEVLKFLGGYSKIFR